MKLDKFVPVDYWKAIILYGLNQATYKIALGKTLLQLAENGKETVEWDQLSKHFLDNYLDRLSAYSRPQQSNPKRLTVMERIVTGINQGIHSYEAAIELVGQNAFNDVIPRFQTIGTDTDIAANKFYHFDHGKKLYIHDTVFDLNQNNRSELEDELDARWSLLEGAFTLGQENYELSNDLREIYLINGYSRTNLTANIPFLNGYQGNVCFYCGATIDNANIHVDHVLPRQVLQHDEIWNLALCHDICNLHKSDALVSQHYIEKLITRNENIMGSNHPWKKKIALQLGATPVIRAKNTWHHWENVKTILNGRYWENSPSYNRETDPFFKKLLTIINNR